VTPEPSDPHPPGGEPLDTVDERSTGAGPVPATLRRAPRYRAFIGTGAVSGVVVALALVVLVPDGGRFSTASVVGYLGAALALVGGLLGGLVAVLAERPRRR